jgi:hypothetical protein
MTMKTSAMWKVAGWGLLGFCAVSVAADRVSVGPVASEVAGLCGAFLGAWAGRRSNPQQNAAAADAAVPAEHKENACRATQDHRTARDHR